MKVANGIVFVAMCLFAVSTYSHLPEQIATHFALDGTPNGYSPRLLALALMPAFYLICIFVLPALIRLSPQSWQIPEDSKSLHKALFSIGLLFAGIEATIVLPALDSQRFHPQSILYISFAVFMLTFGNYLGKIRKNFFIGIRTPWTLTSDSNWIQTHRLAGKLLVIGGLTLLALSPVIKSVTIAIVTLILALIIPAFYSWRLFNRSRTNPQ